MLPRGKLSGIADIYEKLTALHSSYVTLALLSLDKLQISFSFASEHASSPFHEKC